MKELRLEVGKTYIAKNGHKVVILGEYEDGSFPFAGYALRVGFSEAFRIIYTRKGTKWSFVANEWDLVEEVKQKADLTSLEAQIVQWAKNKGIPLEPTNAHPQLEKMKEEVEELEDEILAEIGYETGDLTKIKMELGDVLVTAILQAACWGTSVEECLSLAYAKISKRTGTIIDGVFVKDV